MSERPASYGKKTGVETLMIEVIDEAISKGTTVEEKCQLAIGALKNHPQVDEVLKMLLQPEIFRRIDWMINDKDRK